MDGNDQYGDCTFAAKAHAVTLYRGLVGQSDIMAGPQVVNSYLAFRGGQDTGCTELDVLNDRRQKVLYGDKIISYVSIGPTDHQAVMHAIHLFGGVYLGFQVQQGAQDDFDALKQPDPSVLFPMDGNDQYGDCTFAAKAHAVTLYRGLVGQSDIMAGPQVVNSYLAFTGGQDTGCTELDVLNDWRQNASWLRYGKPRFDGDKIIAYV